MNRPEEDEPELSPREPGEEEIDEGPQSVDLEELGDEADTPTATCPACGRDVYDDASRCPCGHYNPGATSPSRALLVLALLAVAALLVWLLRR